MNFSNKVSAKFLSIISIFFIGNSFAEYSLTNSVIDSFGTQLQQGGYELLSGGGESVIGENTVSNYTLSRGYIYTLDFVTPTSLIIEPRNGGYYNALITITGIATNDFSGVNRVQISIRNMTDTNFYNGTDWTAVSEVWLDAIGTTVWTYTAPAWTDGKTYLIRSRAIDNAGNVEIPGAGNSFTFDTTPPTITITSYPDPYAFNPILGETINLSYSISEIATVKIEVWNRVPNNNKIYTSSDFSDQLAGTHVFKYDGTNWYFIGYDPTKYFLYSYTYIVYATDRAGNKATLSSFGGGLFYDFTVNTGKPVLKPIPPSTSYDSPDPFYPPNYTYLSYSTSRTSIEYNNFYFELITSLIPYFVTNGSIDGIVPISAGKYYWYDIPAGSYSNRIALSGIGKSTGIYEYYIQGWQMSDYTLNGFTDQYSGVVTIYPTTPTPTLISDNALNPTVSLLYTSATDTGGNPVTISITEKPISTLSSDVVYAIQSAINGGLYLVSSIYEVSPTEAILNGSNYPGILYFKYDSSLLGEQLGIYKYVAPLWVEIPSYVDTGNNQLVAEINTVSLYAIFRKKDGIPPVISNLVLEFPIFSPNNDGIKDKVGIQYSLADNSKRPVQVTVEIFDENNKIVRTLIKGAKKKLGLNSEVWDGRDNSQATVIDGIYTCKINVQDLWGNKGVEQTISVKVDNTLPIVELLSPSKEEVGIEKCISGVAKIIGTATDTNFEKYTLFYGVGVNPINWVEIVSSAQQVQEGILGSWDTTILQGGDYVLKLEAIDKAGNKGEDKVGVVIKGPKYLLSIYDYLSHPDKIAIDKAGYIYVADRENDCIKKFDHKGNFIKIGENILNKPEGVGLDNEGNIYVGSRNKSVIEKFDSQGNYVATIGIYYLNKVCGIKVDENGDIVVADRNEDFVRIFRGDGSFKYTIGVEELNKPEDIFIYKDKRGDKYYYVANRNADNIKIFNEYGGLIKTIDCGKMLLKPDGLLVTQNGQIIVADSNNNRVVKLDKYGNINLVITTGGNEEFNHPKGVCLDSLGNLYIADSMNKRIIIFGNELPDVPDLKEEVSEVGKVKKEKTNIEELEEAIANKEKYWEDKKKEREEFWNKKKKERDDILDLPIKKREEAREKALKERWKHLEEVKEVNKVKKEKTEITGVTTVIDSNTGEVIWDSSKSLLELHKGLEKLNAGIINQLNDNQGQGKDKQEERDKNRGKSEGKGKPEDKGKPDKGEGKDKDKGKDEDKDKDKYNNGNGNGGNDNSKGKGKKSQFATPDDIETPEIKSPKFETQKF